MTPRKLNSLRGGFLLLMLIAFTSIILGLSVTFYVYCKRGMEDSQISVRIAQERLALNGALQYVNTQIATMSGSGAASTTKFAPPANNLSWFKLQDTSISRTRSLGWFRVSTATSAYVTANYMSTPFNVSDATKCVFIAAGCGISGGKQIMSSDPEWTQATYWQYESRSWYLAEYGTNPLDALKPKITRLIALPNPPQTGSGAGTVFYW